jgi:hypothetical protein
MLLLFTEMKAPEEAWLEFKLELGNIVQSVAFRPGRYSWTIIGVRHPYFMGLFLEECYIN